MGFFDRFKKKEAASAAPAAESKPCGAAVTELAKLISLGDEVVLRDVSACAGNPQAWFETHQDQYEERGVDSAENPGLIQWLGLVNILEEHGFVCERDWKDELEDFLFFVQGLNGFQAQRLTIDPAWLDAGGDIPAWCDVLTEKWASQGVRMAAIDIDSDSYVLFPFPISQLPSLQKLAEEIGRHIDFVEKM